MSRMPTTDSPASTTPTATMPIPRAIDRFRRITEAYEYLSAHLKDNAHGNGRSRPGPAAPARADAGIPGGYSEDAGRVLTILEETWQAIRARHLEIPPVVIIIASGTTGRDARRGRFDSRRWTIHTTGTLTTILLIQTPQSHVFKGGWANVDLAHGRRRPVASPPPFRVPLVVSAPVPGGVMVSAYWRSVPSASWCWVRVIRTGDPGDA